MSDDISGKRKYRFGLVASLVYSGLVTLLGIEGLQAGADPTGLGIMFGGIATGFGAIMASFVWGNAQEWQAKANIQTAATNHKAGLNVVK